LPTIKDLTWISNEIKIRPEGLLLETWRWTGWRNINHYGFSCTLCEELMRIEPLLYGLAYTHVTELISLNLLKHSLYYIVLHTLT